MDRNYGKYRFEGGCTEIYDWFAIFAKVKLQQFSFWTDHVISLLNNVYDACFRKRLKTYVVEETDIWYFKFCMHSRYWLDRVNTNVLTLFNQYRECIHAHGPLARYVKLRVAHAPGMPGTFSPLPRVSDPDMHYGTCIKIFLDLKIFQTIRDYAECHDSPPFPNMDRFQSQDR